MIGISIAVASRKKSGINMPLILDDIFYASDFENRNSLEGFLIHLFDSFEKYTPNLPLQLIMFTHDEMIFECVNNLSRSMNNDTVIAAKLFHHSQSKYESNFKDLIYKFSEIYNDNQIKEILN